eukprot:1156619-Pelagomonas_calceolata.AAC.9
MDTALAVSNAARTQLMDMNTCQWHEPFLHLFNMPTSALPRIVSNSEVRASRGLTIGMAQPPQKCAYGAATTDAGAAAAAAATSPPIPLSLLQQQQQQQQQRQLSHEQSEQRAKRATTGAGNSWPAFG